MNKNIILTLILLAALHHLSAGNGGTYSFLRNDVSARAAALNGSFVSMTNDPNVLFYNPGSLPTILRSTASIGYMKHLLDVNGGTISYARQMEGIGSVGAGITFIDYGSFNETDESNNVLGSFSAMDLALIVGGGRSIDEQTSVGASIKFIYSSIAGFRSTALALDLGALYQIPSENITLGASLLNLGTQLSAFQATRESLPLDLTVGITKRPEHLPALLNLNFHKLNESQENLLDRFAAFSIGAEFLMSESFRIRLGYSNEKRKELKLGSSSGLAGFSIGAGFLVGEYIIDYAFNAYGKIGNLHRLSVGIDL